MELNKWFKLVYRLLENNLLFHEKWFLHLTRLKNCLDLYRNGTCELNQCFQYLKNKKKKKQSFQFRPTPSNRFPYSLFLTLHFIEIFLLSKRKKEARSRQVPASTQSNFRSCITEWICSSCIVLHHAVSASLIAEMYTCSCENKSSFNFMNNNNTH